MPNFILFSDIADRARSRQKQTITAIYKGDSDAAFIHARLLAHWMRLMAYGKRIGSAILLPPTQTNREFAATNARFQAACEAAGVPPTTRQASKYRRGRGIALKQAAREAA